ncbi:MAG: hypothetical protein ACREJU_02525 [Nitrospiraceae bacterium]
MATAVGFPAKDLKEENPGDWTQFAATTRCLRCSGLMVIERCSDFPVGRCVQCGEVIDPVILRNRRHNIRGELGSNQW